MSLEKKLRAFFMKHDPGRVRLAKRMARQFRGRDEAVLAHLTKIYKSGGVSDSLLKRVEDSKGKLERRAARMADQNAFDAITEEATENLESVVDEVDQVQEEITEEVADAMDNVEDLIDDLDD